jgi:hypothetical protein
MQATRFLAIVLVGGLAFPSAAPAQTISAEVMQVLTRGPLSTPGGNYDLTVGAVPKNFPAELIPAGSTPVASTDSPSMRVALVEVPAAEEAARITFARALNDAGWLSPMPAVRGFSMASTVTLQLCKEFDHVNVQYVPKADRGTYVRISLQHDPRRRCSPRAEAFFTDVPIPALRHPEGARAYGASGGGSSDGYHTGARIDTSMTAAALAAHYHPQVVAAGWEQVTRLADPDLVVVRYTARLKTGEILTAVLTVSTGPGTADLFLRITRPAVRR